MIVALLLDTPLLHAQGLLHAGGLVAYRAPAPGRPAHAGAGDLLRGPAGGQGLSGGRASAHGGRVLVVAASVRGGAAGVPAAELHEARGPGVPGCVLALAQLLALLAVVRVYDGQLLLLAEDDAAALPQAAHELVLADGRDGRLLLACLVHGPADARGLLRFNS